MCVCVCIPVDMVHGTLRLALSTDNRLSMRLGNQQQQHQWLQQHKKGLNRKGQARTIKTKQQQNNNDKPEKKSPERERKKICSDIVSLQVIQVEMTKTNPMMMKKQIKLGITNKRTHSHTLTHFLWNNHMQTHAPSLQPYKKPVETAPTD